MTSHLVPHAPLSASSVRHELVIDLTASHVPPAVVDDAALVMSELVGNAVRHGSPLPPDGGVRVSWELTPDRVHLEVWDGGAATQEVADRGGVPPTAENGRGLTIVSLLAEEWGAAPCPGPGVGVYADLNVHPDAPA